MCLQICRRRTGQGVVFEAEISEHLGGQDVVGQQTQCIARGSNRGHGDGVEVEVEAGRWFTVQEVKLNFRLFIRVHS